jgi:CDP-diacylglycerol--glycerol-3-phosphate 3-phosphatidyltransferase
VDDIAAERREQRLARERPRRPVVGLHQLPNAICVVRVVVIFVALYFIGRQYTTESTWSVLWLVVVTLAALTDRLDGFLAKRYGWTSTLGAFLDQTSDKLVTLALFAFLTVHGAFPVWALAALVFRELFVSGLRITANELGIPIHTGQAGRFKTFVQQTAALGIFLHWATAPGWLGFTWGQWVVWGGWTVFVLVILALGRRAGRVFLRVYRVRRVDSAGREHVSYADLVLVVLTLAFIALPAEIAGPTVVLTITLGTGATYAQGFLWSLRRVGARCAGRWWVGTAVTVVASAATSVGMALTLPTSPDMALMWGLVGAVAVVWIVLLAASAVTGRVYLRR